MSDDTGGGGSPDDPSGARPPAHDPAADPTRAMPATPPGGTTPADRPPGPDEPAPWYKNPSVIVPSVIGVIVIVLLLVLLLDDDDGAADADLADTTSSTVEEPSDDTDTSVTQTTGSPSTASQPATTQANPGAPGPSTAQSALDEARGRFDGFLATAPGDPPTYNMDYRTGVGTHECLVVYGSDVQRVAFEDDCETDEAASNCAQCAPRSVIDLFDTIQRFIDNGVPFTASYDAGDGYPTVIERLDFPPDDPERGFQITMGTVGQGTGD